MRQKLHSLHLELRKQPTHQLGKSLTNILTPTALSDSVAVVTRFAVLARIALGVVQAPETGTRLGIT